MEEQTVSSNGALVRRWTTLPVSSGKNNRCWCGNLPGSQECWKAHQKPISPAKLPN
jgi:hypothetical protein